MLINKLAYFVLSVILPIAFACSGHHDHDHDHDHAQVRRRLQSVESANVSPPIQRSCSMREPEADEIAEMNAIVSSFRASRAAADQTMSVQTTITIPTNIFIITLNDGTTHDITNGMIQKQMDVINAAFAPNFAFSKDSVERVANTAFYNHGINSDYDMKNTLRKGGSDTLNIYFSGAGGGALGYATFPYSGSGNDKDDGVVCLTGTEPGGSESPNNLGDTLTHEIGHWMGLYHTFQGGCNGDGDEIADTPAEAAPTYGCPTPTNRPNTCPNDAGFDSIYNFMSYTDDACMNEFTPNQVSRMEAMWAKFRQVGPSPPAISPAPTLLPTTAAPTPPTPPPTTDVPATAAPTPICDGKIFKLDLRTDQYGSETTWEVKGNGGGVEAKGGPYEDNSDVTVEQCIPNDACNFDIMDSYGDGICCDEGDGSFAVSIDGVQMEVGSGGAFGSVQSVDLCSNPAPTPTTSTTPAPTTSSPTTPVPTTASPTSPAPINAPTSTPPPAAPTPICDGKIFKLDLRTDQYGDETTWEVKGNGGGVVASGGPYEDNSDETVEQCISNDACAFDIMDSYGDGICCDEGNGSFAVSIDGVQMEVGSGGAFGDGQSVDLCSNPAPTPTTSTTPAPTIASPTSPAPINAPTSTPPPSVATPPTYGVGPVTLNWVDGAGVFAACGKTTTVFGVAICVTPTAWAVSQLKCNHIANVFLQLLDNNADGSADDAKLVRYMVEKQYYMFVPATEEDEIELPQQGVDQMTGIYEAYPNTCDTPGNRGASNTDRSTWVEAVANTPGNTGCDPNKDATTEEILHLITTAAGELWPDLWAPTKTSKAGEASFAMNGNCGWGYLGNYINPSGSSPSCTGLYAYDDATCDLACVVVEGIYWSSVTWMGGLMTTARANDVSEEWQQTVPDASMRDARPSGQANAMTLEEGSPAMYALISDTTSEGHLWLPTSMPDGRYAVTDANANASEGNTLRGRQY